MILSNPAPELVRLRTAMNIQRPSFRAWLDANLERVLEQSNAVALAGDEPAPVLRAQFIHETWKTIP